MVQIKKKLGMKNWIILFLFINLVIKTISIQSIPSASTYDEVIYSSEAQSIVKYGTDLKGDWRPWDLEPSDSYYTELTSTVIAPGFLLFPNNPVAASKFIPIILGSILPILLGLLAFRLRKEKSVFIATTIIATLNPWIFQFSRMGYDALFSMSFYLMGMLAILYLKNWKKLWAIIPLFLGFFQYQGHKVLLVPMVGLALLLLLIENHKKIFKNISLRAAFSVLIFSILLTVVYLVRLPHLTSGARISEFSVFDKTELSSSVNDARRLSLSSPASNVFINKFTALVTTMTDRFLDSFDLKILFIRGDASVDTFTVLDYGYFHLIDIAVIAISIMFIFANRKDYKVAVFVLLFIGFGTLPNVIRTGHSWIIFRAAFMFIGLVLLMGIGSSAFLDLFKKKHSKPIAAVYLLATIPFFYAYFYKYPISHTNNIGFYERVVASYIARVGMEKPIYIVPDRDDATFDYLIHYNQLLTKDNRAQISQSMKTRKYEINTIKIEGGCTDEVRSLTDTTVFVFLPKQPCEPEADPAKTTEIKSLIDTGTIFTVFNDNLCSQYNLNPYPNIKKNVMAVEKLTDQEFCENFFSRR